MIPALFTWLAFPVYVWQGLSVRRKLERLPTPDIEREGFFGDGKEPDIRLLVAGDSSVAGVGMTTVEDTLAYNLAKELHERTGQTVYWRAAGANSATSADIRDHVIPNIDRWDFTHVLLAVGTNDMKNFHVIRRFKKAFGSLIYTTRTRYPSARIVWSPVADMRHIPALPPALGRILNTRGQLINAKGAELCRERGAIMAEPLPIEGPEGFARDGFHAGPEGYRSWARHLAPYLVPENRNVGNFTLAAQ